MKDLINKMFGDLFSILHFEKNFVDVNIEQISTDENLIKSELKFSTKYKGKHNYVLITIAYSIKEEMISLKRIESLEYKIENKFVIEKNIIIDKLFQIIESIPKQI